MKHKKNYIKYKTKKKNYKFYFDIKKTQEKRNRKLKKKTQNLHTNELCSGINDVCFSLVRFGGVKAKESKKKT